MISGECLVTRKPLAKLMTIWVCIGAFSLFCSPQISVVSWVQNSQQQAPTQEDNEDSEEAREVISSARHRENKRRDTIVCRLKNPSKRPVPARIVTSAELAIIGHQLANGLCAPLLV